MLALIPYRAAAGDEIDSARADVDSAKGRMGRSMPQADLRDLLVRSRESPQWDEVASRCLTCGNCTMVCPTCFCTSTEDVSDLTGEHAERWREVGVVFRIRFHLHSRRRQRPPVGGIALPALAAPTNWAPGTTSSAVSGCVGCGRCIAWCPTGIDITAEMDKMADWPMAMTDVRDRLRCTRVGHGAGPVPGTAPGMRRVRTRRR